MTQGIAYLLLVAFFVADAAMRKGDGARTLTKTGADKGSTTVDRGRAGCAADDGRVRAAHSVRGIDAARGVRANLPSVS